MPAQAWFGAMAAVVAALWLAAPAMAAGPASSQPFVWPDPGQDVRVFTHAVRDFGAKADGQTDDTAAFQKALDAAADGGGIVYAPAGRYVIRGRLRLPTAVTLRGDWTPPDTESNATRTVLALFAGRNEPAGADAITVRPAACLRDVVIYYPEQTVATIVPYSPTIGLHANAAAVRLTLVNPYVAVRGVPSSVAHHIKDLYATPLHEGIWIDVCTDVGRVLNSAFGPEYWEDAGLPGSPRAADERAALRAHLRANVVGLRIGYSDAEHLTCVRVAGCKTGLWLTKRTDGQKSGLTVHSYGEAAGVVIEDCGEAIRCDYANHIVGWRFSGSRFAGRDAAVRGTGGATIQFAGCSFASQNGPAIQFPAKADVDVILGFAPVRSADVLNRTGMTFHACRFEQYEGVAIEALSGELSVTDSDFLADAPAANLGADLVAATFVGNRFKGEPRISGACPRTALDHKPVQWDKVDLSAPRYAPDPRPAGDGVINARDAAYGAIGDGQADDTAAIQRALDATAGKPATVFLPAGVYRCGGTLSVPAGVELRGIGGPRPDKSLSPGGAAGTLLMATAGRGRPDAAPFIQAAAGAGVRGLRIAYPDLFDLGKAQPYPWTIRLAGAGAYVLDVALSNSDRGIDAAADRHLVRNLTANVLRLAVRTASCADGRVEDVHIHPQYFSGVVKFMPAAMTTTAPEEPKRILHVFRSAITLAQAQTTCFEIGDCRRQRFVNPSTWPPDVGFRVTSPKAEAHILSCTLETHTPVWLDEAGRIELVNANAPVVGIRSGPKFAGAVHAVNYLLRTGHRPRECLDLTGPGTVILTQCWFKWIPAGGEELQLAHGDLRLLGGMMVDVSQWKRSGGRLSLTGVIANDRLFEQEIRDGRANVGVRPVK